MCGISGYYSSKKSNNPSSDAFQSISKKQHERRGPDDFGVYLSPNNTVGLAHSRLSLVDLSGHGHQPMSKHNKILIFNGEIYNFRAIKSELETLGYEFFSTSDSEVILSAFDCWGVACFSKFNGPFALSIYDELSGLLVIARDRIGEKPLYIYDDEAAGVFYFGSTIKFILEICQNRKWELDVDRVVSDLIFNFWSDKTHTHIKDVYNLPTGNYISIDTKKGTRTTAAYWQLQKDESRDDESTVLQNIEELLVDSVNLRTSLDTEIGVVLSGGLDSTLLTSLAMKNLDYKPHCFTLAKGEYMDEDLHYASKVCDDYGIPHHKVQIRDDDLSLEKLVEVTKAMEEPSLDQVYVYINRNYETIHHQKLKAALNGQGADEIFLGYLDYYSFLRDENNYSSAAALKRYWLQQSPLRDAIDRDLLERIIDENITRHFVPYMSDDKLNSVLRFGVKTHLPALLAQEDKQSMNWSVECRTAFTDYRLVEYLSSVPSYLKKLDGREKYILRKIGEKHVPTYITKRKKLGFPDLPDKRQEFIQDIIAKGLLTSSPLLTSLIDESLLKYTKELPLSMQWRLCSIAILEKSLL
jgi:asparagine synthase (glutamine-hydrolysing)